jgi:hypothetical protein
MKSGRLNHRPLWLDLDIEGYAMCAARTEQNSAGWRGRYAKCVAHFA